MKVKPIHQRLRHPTKARKRIADGGSGGVDFGPAVYLPDGRRGGASIIDIETREDVGRSRLVRGARRRNVLLDLQSRGSITRAQRNAAEQFLDDLSIASGGSGSDDPTMPSLNGPRSGLPERQVSALTRVNKVRLLLGLNIGTVFWHVVFENGSLADYEGRNRLRNGAATTLLRAALTALDEHYHHTMRRFCA